MSAGTHPEATRRVSILRGVRAAARRQADVARSAADDFEAAGDPRMAQMLRRQRRVPGARRRVASGA